MFSSSNFAQELLKTAAPKASSPVTVKHHEFLGSSYVTHEQPEVGVGGSLWESALVLAEHLESTRGAEAFAGRRVLELGAGTGLLGVLLAALGAQVTVTDKFDTVQLLQQNVDANVALHPHLHVRVVELAWGEPLPNAIKQQPFDMIVGSEVIYNGKLYRVLLETMLKVASVGRCQMMMSYERRSSEDKWLSMLQEHPRISDIKVEQIDENGHLVSILSCIIAAPA